MGAKKFPWVSHHRMTSDQYQSYFDKYTGQGYNLTWVSGYNLDGKDIYAAIWYKEDGPAFVARHRMTSDEYQTYFDKYSGGGYKLMDVSGYELNGTDYYAAFWNKQKSNEWVSHHRMSSEQYQSYFDKYVENGYILNQVNGYNINGNIMYAAIWTKAKSPAFMARHGMTSSQYQSYFDKYVAEGYRLVDVSGYDGGKEALYAAIWYKESGNAWVARHGMTSDQYQNIFDGYVNEGYRLNVVSGYVVNGVDYYAAIWEMP